MTAAAAATRVRRPRLFFAGSGGWTTILAAIEEGGTSMFGAGLLKGSWAWASADWNAAFISPMVPNRSAGFFAVALRMTRSMASGTLGLLNRASGIGSLMCLSITAMGVSA